MSFCTKTTTFLTACLAMGFCAAEEETRAFTGCLWNEFENAYLSSSGTLCDTRPISMQNLDWRYSMGEAGYLWGYGCFLGTLHNRQRELHRAAFNEFEGGVFYGYDYEVSENVQFVNSFGGVWNPLFGYHNGNRDTLWEWRYFQSLENPYITPFWDALGLIDPDQWVRIRFGVRHTFELTDSLFLTPCLEGVWGTARRFYARYGERPNDDFLEGAFVTSTAGIKLEWRINELWSIWFKVRQFDTLNHQARRLERRKTSYWAKPDYTIFTLGMGLHF